MKPEKRLAKMEQGCCFSKWYIFKPEFTSPFLRSSFGLSIKALNKVPEKTEIDKKNGTKLECSKKKKMEEWSCEIYRTLLKIKKQQIFVLPRKNNNFYFWKTSFFCLNQSKRNFSKVIPIPGKSPTEKLKLLMLFSRKHPKRFFSREPRKHFSKTKITCVLILFLCMSHQCKRKFCLQRLSQFSETV